MTPLKDLLALAEKATEGPWYWNGDGLYCRQDNLIKGFIIEVQYEYDCGAYIKIKDGDENFIAAANPAQIISMIKALELAKSELLSIHLQHGDEDNAMKHSAALSAINAIGDE